LSLAAKLWVALRESVSPSRIALIMVVVGAYFLVSSAVATILGIITLFQMLVYVWTLSGLLILTGEYASFLRRFFADRQLRTPVLGHELTVASARAHVVATLTLMCLGIFIIVLAVFRQALSGLQLTLVIALLTLAFGMLAFPRWSMRSMRARMRVTFEKKKRKRVTKKKDAR